MSFVTKDFSGLSHKTSVAVGTGMSALPRGAPPTSKRVGVGPDLKEVLNVPHVHNRHRRSNTLKLYLIEAATH